MYKVDLKTLNEITETLDILSNVQKSTMAEFIKATEKAKNLSQKIKDEYTQIKK
jgi:hypothetical protein